MKIGMRHSIFLLAALILFACSDRPDNIASDSEMVKVMADLEMAQAYLQNKGYTNNNPQNRERILKYILEKNGMSREDFDSTIVWYGKHIDKYDDLYAKVDKELARRESRISGNSIEVLSNDLWPYSRHFIISPKSSTDNLSFNITPEDIDRGGKLTWKLKLNSTPVGTALFGVKYSNGNVSYTSQNISGNNFEISLQTDTALSIREIFGNIRISDNHTFVGIDSISLTSAPFDSTIYYQINTLRRFNVPVRKIKKVEKVDSIAQPKDSTFNS